MWERLGKRIQPALIHSETNREKLGMNRRPTTGKDSHENDANFVEETIVSSVFSRMQDDPCVPFVQEHRLVADTSPPENPRKSGNHKELGMDAVLAPT